MELVASDVSLEASYGVVPWLAVEARSSSPGFDSPGLVQLALSTHVDRLGRK